MSQTEATTPPKKEPFPVQAARFSIVGPLVVIALNVAIFSAFNHDQPAPQDNMRRLVGLLQGFLSLAIFLAGFIFAIVALFGMRRYGKRGIFGRAMAGLLINGLILAIFAVVLGGAWLNRTTTRGAPALSLAENSLPEATYIEKGLPRIDQPWQAKDFKAAIPVLAGISKDNAHHLPRWNNANSGKVFARMTSNDNFVSLKTNELPVDLRLKEEAAQAQVFEGLTKVYGDAAHRGAVYDEELVELMRFSLQLSANMMADMDAFAATIPANNPSRDAALRQFQLAKTQMAGAVGISVDLLGDSKTLPLAARQRFARYVRDILPPLLKQLAPEGRESILGRLRSVETAERDADLKQTMGQTIAACESVAR